MMLDPQTITLWTAALIGAGTVLAGIVKFFFYLYDEIMKRASSKGHTLPGETLRIAMKSEHNYWWHMGGIGNNPAMQIVGDFLVTNISATPVRIPQMELRYGLWGRKRVRGGIIVEGPNQMYGMYDIAPNATPDSRADFWIFPPAQNANQPFVAHSIVFYDQFSNKHSLKKVRFGYT
jgi:hypothetical protein